MLSDAMTYDHAVDALLHDKTRIRLRRIRWTDKRKLLEHFKYLSPGSSYNRRRAYEPFLARSEGSGSQMEDWLDAERELRAQVSI